MNNIMIMFLYIRKLSKFIFSLFMNISSICKKKKVRLYMIDRFYSFVRIKQIAQIGTDWAHAPTGALRNTL